jgi:predicted RND superfamily exporter protein
MTSNTSSVRRISFQSYLGFVIRWPLWVLIGVAAITVWFSWYLPSLSFKTTVYDLIIESLPEARAYEDFRDLFGSDEIIRLVVQGDDILEPLTFAKVTRLSDACAGIPGVRRVISLPEVRKTVDPRSEWNLTRFAGMLAPVALFQRNLISEDHRTTIITMVLGDDANKKAVIHAVDAVIRQSGKQLTLYQIGIPEVSEALAHYSRQDFLRLTPVTLVVIAVLLLVLFRNVHCLLLPLSCVSLAMVWTFGCMAWSGVSVSMLTIIVPVILIAVGTAYCLHICSEYLNQAALQPDAGAATRATFSRMALPIALAVLTTIIGIASLMINRITAIKEFAYFACFGIASLLVIALTFLPAMLALLPLPAADRRGAAKGLARLFNKLLARIISLNLGYQKQCLTVLGGIAAICVLGIFFIRVETNPVSFFKPNTPVSRHFHAIYRQMSGSFPMHVVMSGPTEDYFESPANVSELDRCQRFLDTLPGVDKSVSFADYLKLVNYAYNRFDPQYYALPEDAYEMRLLINNFKSLLGNDLLRGFMSPDLRQANILLLTHIASSRHFLSTKAAIFGHVRKEFDRALTWQVTGLGMVIAASSQQITIGQVKSLTISLVLIFGIMVALFVSSKVGLIAVVPNLFPILVNFGFMGLLGIPLSVATSLIASVAIGLAVDDTIHYLVRYNSEFKKDLDKDRAMHETILAVGRPILFTSLTIGLGFSVLLFSHFQPTAIFGLLMVITTVSALIGDLILLPSLMLHVELVTAWDLMKMIPTVGTISPGMVHELNQPLNAIKVGNDVIRIMLKKGSPLNAGQLDAVTLEIGRQVTRASQIIERFSVAGNIPGFEKKPIHINDPIRNALDLLEHQLKLDRIHVEAFLSRDLPQIMAHHNRLVQVIYNILTNSREAVAARRMTVRSVGAAKILLRSSREDNRVVVTVEDTGQGIEEHNLDRIFEPFFTTKGIGKGKGLGLTISKQIVRDCGGRIAVRSTWGKGTVVVISFPAVVDKPAIQ